ncbi:response regulator [Candidatus Peregrinibacteria bacterium]|nr:response regulator [Candidatus Peregrinibacteria bacterium]
MSDSKLPESEIPKGKVLLVDDDELVRKALQWTIRGLARSDKMELAVDSVESVDLAIEKIQGGLNPDVILSDMMMPEKTGKDFLDWLEKEHPELVRRFCFVSGGAKEEDLKALLGYMGAMGRMIEKPFEIDQVRDVIRSILNLK